MENEEKTNQKIQDQDIENVAGGAKLHLDTTDKEIPAKVDAVYLNLKEYFKLRKAGVIGKDKTISLSDIKRVSEKDLQDILSNTQLTAGKKKLWEIKVNIV